MNQVFIGYDSNEVDAAEVCAWTAQHWASIPLDITYLKLADLDFNRPREADQSTEFTYTRFLVPHLCGFKGKAVYMDSDMIPFADMNQLFEYPDTKALYVVKQDHQPTESLKKDGKIQTTYPRKNWSSLMYMNCDKLTAWTKEAVETLPGNFLQRLSHFKDEEIGELDPLWNCLDEWQQYTKILHFTTGGPWLEKCAPHKWGELWNYFWMLKYLHERQRDTVSQQ